MKYTRSANGESRFSPSAKTNPTADHHTMNATFQSAVHPASAPFRARSPFSTAVGRIDRTGACMPVFFAMPSGLNHSPARWSCGGRTSSGYDEIAHVARSLVRSLPHHTRPRKDLTSGCTAFIFAWSGEERAADAVA
jgi:hypothetical protein